MRLHEHEAASLFRQAGVPVAPFAVARTADEAVAVLAKVELPVVIKAQVLVGSRGKHGGILPANTEAEVREKAGGLLGQSIRGFAVDTVMVSKRVPVASELYVGVTVDAVAGAITVILGTAGGIDVEISGQESFPFHSKISLSLKRIIHGQPRGEGRYQYQCWRKYAGPYCHW